MSQQLVALGCCIDSHSHRDFHGAVTDLLRVRAGYCSVQAAA
jgi:hypothetical protein